MDFACSIEKGEKQQREEVRRRCTFRRETGSWGFQSVDHQIFFSKKRTTGRNFDGIQGCLKSSVKK